MDTGVGGFVFSGGVVSLAARNDVLEITKNINFAPAKFMKQALIDIFSKNAKLLVIGFTKFLGVFLLNYQTHLSEYGRHWNFFLTLGLNYNYFFCFFLKST